MPFEELMTDLISVYDDQGRLVIENEKALVSKGNSIQTLNGNFPVDIGYFVERKRNNGLIDKYKVIEPNYFGGIEGIPCHYQMSVINIKSISKDQPKPSEMTINVSGNGRVYQHSIDKSRNTYSLNSSHYEPVLLQIKSDIVSLNLDGSNQLLVDKVLDKIMDETKKSEPSKDVISTLISLFPVSVATLESVINLSNMLGLS